MRDRMPIDRALLLVGLCVLFCLSTSTWSAAQGVGAIGGTVADASGAVLPGDVDAEDAAGHQRIPSTFRKRGASPSAIHWKPRSFGCEPSTSPSPRAGPSLTNC